MVTQEKLAETKQLREFCGCSVGVLNPFLLQCTLHNDLRHVLKQDIGKGFPVSWRMCFDLLVELQIDLIIAGSFVVLLKLLDYDWYNTVR